MTTTAEIERALITALDTIRNLWPALMLATTSGSLGAASSDEVTPLDRRISLRHEVTLTLNSWARVIVEDRDLSHGLPLGTDTVGLCELIARHATWFSGHEAANDALTELTAAAGEVRNAALPQRREWMALGTCPLEVEQEVQALDSTEPYTRVVGACGGQVRAYPDKEPRCQRCGTAESVAWWERVMFPDVECAELVTADELVPLLHRAFGGAPIKPSTLRQWIRREVITSAGKDPQGRTLYSRKEVIEALAARAG